MKKALAVAIVTLLASSLAFAQASGGSTSTASKAGQTGKKTSIKLNPQPEPPGVQKSSRNTSPGSKAAINPQPLPPRSTKASPGSKVALNPQPLPPGAKKTSTSPGSKVSLNPQPLPPRTQTANQKRATGPAQKSKKSSSSTPTTTSPK